MSAADLKQSKKLVTALKRKLQPGPERGGLILPGPELVELENSSDQPLWGFQINLKVEDLDLLSEAIGSFHTHPSASANLSSEDWVTFVNWPDWVHVIVGTDGLRWYTVENGMVLNA